MFRTALRQSSRTVGAISASGRVAAVSQLSSFKQAVIYLDGVVYLLEVQLTSLDDAIR
jgi:hypothetical protein